MQIQGAYLVIAVHALPTRGLACACVDPDAELMDRQPNVGGALVHVTSVPQHFWWCFGASCHAACQAGIFKWQAGSAMQPIRHCSTAAAFAVKRHLKQEPCI